MEPGQNTDHLCAWLALRHAPGIGPLIFRRLIDRFGSPENVFCAQRAELMEVEGISTKSVDAVLNGPQTAWAQKEVARCRSFDYRIITLKDKEYPAWLARIFDPPSHLYAFGRQLTQKPAIAVVGTRNPTRYGLSMARRLSAELVDMGFAVISGLARGIDSAAHKGALDAGGTTIAVLGSGLSVIYPPENKKLYFDISKKGTIVSELPVDELPNSYNFPARNRIISGMSFGTVVVEAAKKSGSLITARMAAEQGREVFAVPGNINSFKSTGTHELLKQGARLVESGRDVIEELAPLLVADGAASGETTIDPGPAEQKAKPVELSLTPDESRVYHALDPYPVHIDQLASILSMDAGSLLSFLLNLELKGLVCQMPGKYFCISGVK